jgi:hypothetical protein
MITFFNIFVVANHNKIIVFLFLDNILAPIKVWDTPQKKCHDYYMTLCEMKKDLSYELIKYVGEITL